MLFSLCYLAIRQFLQVLALRIRSNDYKDLEILVPRHEIGIFRRRTPRPRAIRKFRQRHSNRPDEQLPMTRHMVDTVCWQVPLVALVGWVNRHQLQVHPRRISSPFGVFD